MGQAIKRNPKVPRQQPALLPKEVRLTGCEEVCQGLTLEQAQTEALRCLNCKDPVCVEACISISRVSSGRSPRVT